MGVPVSARLHCEETGQRFENSVKEEDLNSRILQRLGGRQIANRHGARSRFPSLSRPKTGTKIAFSQAWHGEAGDGSDG
jgi:hypothetical protein